MKFVILLLVLAAIVFAIAYFRNKRSKRAVKVSDAKQSVQTKRSANLSYPGDNSQVTGGSTYRSTYSTRDTSRYVPPAKKSAPKSAKPKKSYDRDDEDVYGGYVETPGFYAGSDEYSRPSYTDPTPQSYDYGSSSSGYSGGSSSSDYGSSSGGYSSGSSDSSSGGGFSSSD